MNSYHLSQLLTTAYRCSLLPAFSPSPKQTSIPSQVTLLSFSSSVLWRLLLRSFHIFLQLSHLFEWTRSGSHPCLCFCLVLTVFSYFTPLRAFKLISINSSSFHEGYCCPGSMGGEASPSRSLGKRARESLARFEEVSLLSSIRPLCPRLPWKRWPKPGLRHILLSRLFAFCTFSVHKASC